MGFDDRFKIVVSDTQMYKQAGNSIVSNNFIEILKQLDMSIFEDGDLCLNINYLCCLL